jgi:adenosyl cobinamide kinase/adenosyl cobinamide phosphate guanylyltransferase
VIPAVGRKFTELGWMNQYIAATADTVVLMVSGSCNYKDKIK